MMEQVAAQQKPDASRQLEIGIAINWLGKARFRLNRITDALALHQREVAVYQEVLNADPSNTQAKMREAVAWQHVGQTQEDQGDLSASSAARDRSLLLMQQLRAIEPANTEWQETELRAMLGKIDGLFYRQRHAASGRVHQNAQDSLKALIASDPKNTIWSVELRSALDVRGARLALTTGNAATALSLAQGALRALTQGKDLKGEEAARIRLDAQILAGDALARLGRRTEAEAVWQSGFDSLAPDVSATQSRMLRTRFLLLRRLGRSTEAADIAKMLDRQGYRHPAYLSAR